MRPRYPAAMVDDLLAGQRLQVLDVGCGTGIAAEAFVARGCQVHGVEPDSRMAAVAERKGITVDVSAFEEWAAGGREFDLVISGQAWHWVDPEVGLVKAASVLRPGGRLATFWNLARHDPETQAALDQVYGRHAPALVKGSLAVGRAGADPGGDEPGVRSSGLFDDPQVRKYSWTQQHTTAEWIGQLPTHSDHRLLEPRVLSALLHDLADLIDERGGQIVLLYETLLVTATRR